MFLNLKAKVILFIFMPTRSNSKPTITMNCILHVISSESLVKGTHLKHII